MKKIFTLLVGATFGLAAVGDFPDSASAQTFPGPNVERHGVVGHGNFVHARRAHTYFPKAGPYGYGNYGVSDRWQNKPHWHYYPAGVYRQGKRFQYLEGHYEWHQSGPIPGANQ